MVYLHNGILLSRKKELLPFATAWVELESIMLSEISQTVKDKYHMILFISSKIDVEIQTPREHSRLTAVSRRRQWHEGIEQKQKIFFFHFKWVVLMHWVPLMHCHPRFLFYNPC